MEIAKLEVMIGELARHVLCRIFTDSELAVRLGSRENLEAFWALDPLEREGIWSDKYDLDSPLADFWEESLDDGQLGLERP
jgi:hypothetical protein